MTPRTMTRRDMLRVAGIAGGVVVAGGATTRVLGKPLVGGNRGTISSYQEVPEAELTFYFGANPVEAETRNKVIEGFNAKFPQIKINPVIAGQDAVQELQVQFAGGGVSPASSKWRLL